MWSCMSDYVMILPTVMEYDDVVYVGVRLSMLSFKMLYVSIVD